MTIGIQVYDDISAIIVQKMKFGAEGSLEGNLKYIRETEQFEDTETN